MDFILWNNLDMDVHKRIIEHKESPKRCNLIMMMLDILIL
jgi:hypothetical protein